MLGGYLVAYLNLDKVIKIIRNEDEPKPVLMKTFKLTDVQADAILNMRLRNLRKLEEMEIRDEDKALREERKKLKALLGSTEQQWKTDRRRDQGGAGRRSARRPSSASAAPSSPRRPSTTRPRSRRRWSVREPITVVVSEKGWIRALRGHVSDLSGVAFKADDGLKFAFPAETTAKVLVFATNGRFYTLDAAKLPGGRGHGEPMRLFIDLEQDADVVGGVRLPGRPQVPGGERGGRGFVVPEDEVLGNTRKGKQVLNVEGARQGRRLAVGRRRTGRGDRREPQAGDLPARAGAGDDARARRAAAALQGGGPVRREDIQGGRRPDLDRRRRPQFHAVAQGVAAWRGNRADAGRLAPKGFPKSNKFRAAPSGGKNANEE